MKSFRIIFIDVDESFSTSTVEAPIKGYMICRAPKGTTDATYFPYGNEKTINAMIGLQTANWPDLYEAVAFNTEYGLYISAPPGTAQNYPSYYGGVYLTSKTMYDYWRVDDKDNPSYEVQVYPGFESKDFDSELTDSEWEISKINLTPNSQGIIQLTKVSPSLVSKLNYMNFKCWDDTGTGIDVGTEMIYHFDNGKIYPVVDDADVKDTPVGYYTLTNEGYTIVLGAVEETIDAEGNKSFTSASNTAATRDINFLNFMKLFDYSGAITTDENGQSKVATNVQLVDQSISNLTGEDLIKYLVLKGSGGQKFQLKITDGASSTLLPPCSPVVGIMDRLFYRVNIKNDCFMRISQKSPNEVPTSVTINNIGYDKYLYDLNVRYILKEDFVSKPASATNATAYIGLDQPKRCLTTNTTKVPANNFLKDLAASNDKYIIDVISSVDAMDWTPPESTSLHSLWQYDPNTDVWTDVTPDYKTKNFYVSGPLMNSDVGKAYSDDVDVNIPGATGENIAEGYVHSSCTGSIWYIASTGKVGKYGHTSYKRTLDGTYKLQSDINFNTVTLSCKEQVYPGSYMSGGEFTGSLSETGVGADGSNIYWPNVLSPNDASFIEVVPVHTLDELGVIDDKGFFTQEKIVDPIGPAQDVKTFTIKGQRTMTNAIQANINAGTLGCAWTKNALPGDGETTVESVFAAAINDGIIEAQQNCYDDALIFMECSGQEQFKSKLMSLRTVYHDTCTIISPKIITKAEFNKPETITVSGRSKGTAQYIGEFKMYDTYTGKYYWCQPIGDVGVNLARIMEKKLGGIAPAGTNDSSGLGGVLSRAVLDKKWDFSDDALRIMDEKGLNPITYDAKNGLMMQSQKSTQDGMVTDWSYLGHSMSFDLCKREIRDKVMVDQLHKRINDYWYNIRTKQVQAILDKRITGTDPIWAEATVDIASVNTAQTKAQRKFMITVKVKVYPYSDYVVLTFTTMAQE